MAVLANELISQRKKTFYLKRKVEIIMGTPLRRACKAGKHIIP